MGEGIFFLSCGGNFELGKRKFTLLIIRGIFSDGGCDQVGRIRRISQLGQWDIKYCSDKNETC